MKNPDDLAQLIQDVTGCVPTVSGAGGGGGGKGGSSSSSSAAVTQAPDTLFSTATISIVDLLSEGEIAGIINDNGVGLLQNMFLNDVPVQNSDGSMNFKGLAIDYRYGTPDQGYMGGFTDVQTQQNIGTKVKQQQPVSAQITEPAANRAKVTLQFPALFAANADGRTDVNGVTYRVEVRYNGGPWINSTGDVTIRGKTTSGYYRTHQVGLPVNPNGTSAPWTVRVTRISQDADDFNNSQNKYTLQSDIIFYSCTTVIDAKFAYPNSVVVGISAQASSFGSSVPMRKYIVDGVKIQIPSNYDGNTGYNGVWDGTFKTAYSNNPAWVLYALLNNDRFGLGDYIKDGAIDKWSLYDIGRYCDGLVPDGYGGQEKRATFNGVIETRQEAFELLQLVAQVFRGMVYWSSGNVTAAQDRPRDPVMLVTESNVIGGELNYSSSSYKARHTVAVVRWQNPANNYKVDYEVVEDNEGIGRYGYNPTSVDLLGCTSRGQARRAGKWILLTELKQTQVLGYKAGLDHATLRPGDVVAVQDPSIVALDDTGRLSGRTKATSTATKLDLDRSIHLDGTQYYVECLMPDGTVQTATVTNGAGDFTSLTLNPGFTTSPGGGAVFIVYGNIVPRLFSIVSIHEEEPHIFAVTALEYQAAKYAAVDVNANFTESKFSELGTKVAAPTNLQVRESQYVDLGVAKQGLTLSWQPADAFGAYGYYVTAIRPSGAAINLPRTASVSVDFTDVDNGAWTFIVTAIGINGNFSPPAQLGYTVQGWAASAPTTVTNLQVLGGGSTFTGQSCTLTWTNNIPANTSPYPVVNNVQVYDASTNVLLHAEALPAGVTKFTYDYNVNVNEGGPRRTFRVAVCARYAGGADGPYASLAVSNPAPAKVNPSVTATSDTIFVNCQYPTDPDFQGFLIWASKTQGFNPLTTPVTMDTQDSLGIIKADQNSTYYVREAAYDKFGKTPGELNISDEYTVYVSANAFDTTAPAIPGTPSLTSTLEIAPDGTATSVVKATWAQDTSPQYGSYDVQFAQSDTGTAEADKGYVGDTTAVSKWEHHGFTPGKTVSVKVRAISANGFAKSGYSPVATIVAATNGAAPTPVTGLSVVAAFQTAFVTWTPSTSADVAYVEVWSKDGSNTGGTPVSGSTLLGKVSAGSSTFIDSTIPATGTRTYWVRPVNTSGTVAASYTGPVVATSAALVSAQIANGAITSTQLGPNSVTSNAIAANSITSGMIVAGTIAGDRIAAGAITTNNLAANAVTAAKIAAGVLTADTITVGNGNITSLINGSNTTKINGGAISANSIDASRLYVGQRGIVFTNIEFYQERDSNGALTGNLAWTSGQVGYKDASNVSQTATVAAGKVARGSDSWQVVWWDITQPTVLQSNAGNNVATVQNGPNNVICATSADSTGVCVYFGGTRIDGTKITALSIAAGQIAAGAIQTQHMSAGSINGDRITAGTLTADKIGAGTISANTIIYVGPRNLTFIQSQPGGGTFRGLSNNGSNLRFALGYIGDLTGDTTDFGTLIWGPDNQIAFRISNGLNYLNGAYIGDATITTAKIGVAQIDYLRVAGGAVSQIYSGESGTEKAAYAQFYSRGGYSKYQISGFRGGDGGTRYGVPFNNGILWIQGSTDGQNWFNLRGVPNVASYQWDPSVNANYTLPQATSIVHSWAPSYVGNLYVRILDTSTGNSGGLYVSVTELAR